MFRAILTFVCLLCLAAPALAQYPPNVTTDLTNLQAAIGQQATDQAADNANAAALAAAQTAKTNSAATVATDTAATATALQQTIADLTAWANGTPDQKLKAGAPISFPHPGPSPFPWPHIGPYPYPYSGGGQWVVNPTPPPAYIYLQTPMLATPNGTCSGGCCNGQCGTIEVPVTAGVATLPAKVVRPTPVRDAVEKASRKGSARREARRERREARRHNR
jgi:type II secretory pathway pseudopilin PulG